MTEPSGNEKRREGEPEVRGVPTDADMESPPTLSEEELGRLVEFFRILDRWDREMTKREARKKVA